MTFISLLGIVTALLVVTSTSTVYSVLWLVGTFMIVSALLGLFNLGFPALLYIIVYVGAIAILFIFVVQLLDLGAASEQPSDSYNETSQTKTNRLLPNSNTLTSTFSHNTILATIISLALLSIFVIAGPMDLAIVSDVSALGATGLDTLIYGNLPVETMVDSGHAALTSGTSGSLSNTLLSSTKGGTPQVQALAEWLYGPGLLPLIVISIILLVAMIAPISLCKEQD